MRVFKGLLTMLLVLTFLAFSSISWADKKPKQKDYQGWDDQWDTPDADRPPGWDKGKKTGWRGHDLPPGQEKKSHPEYKYKKKYRYENEGWRND